MKYIFYCIYNSQYLDGNNKVNKTPWIEALGMMIGGSFIWAGIIEEILYAYVLKQDEPDALLYITAISIIFACYFGFIKDKKYEAIYEQYKVEGGSNSTKEKSIAISYLFVGFTLFILITLKIHKMI